MQTWWREAKNDWLYLVQAAKQTGATKTMAYTKSKYHWWECTAKCRIPVRSSTTHMWICVEIFQSSPTIASGWKPNLFRFTVPPVVLESANVLRVSCKYMDIAVCIAFHCFFSGSRVSDGNLGQNGLLIAPQELAHFQRTRWINLYDCSSKLEIQNSKIVETFLLQILQWSCLYLTIAIWLLTCSYWLLWSFIIFTYEAVLEQIERGTNRLHDY